MNQTYSFERPIILQPTLVDLVADYYWNNRRALAMAAKMFAAGAFLMTLAVIVEYNL